jgi:GntR family transcriptional regulator
VRQTRYQRIADALRPRLHAGEFPPGSLLPSEADLSADYAASRVTIRRALDVLRDEGLVDSRQGFGWFVATDPLRQTLGRLATVEGQLADDGVESERHILEFAFVPAPDHVAAVLDTDSVLEVRRVNLADGRPFARVTVWCPASLAADLSRRDVERASFYDLLGIRLGGAVQTIAAGSASPGDAELLHVPAGSPVLECQRITRDDDHAVLMSEFVFPGHLTEFVVDLPRVESSIAPTGLRLLESPGPVGRATGTGGSATPDRAHRPAGGG